MTFYERFTSLCKQLNVAPSVIASEAGLDKSIVTYWKNHPYATPKFETVLRLAEVLHVNSYVLDESLNFNLGTDITGKLSNGAFVTIDGRTKEAYVTSLGTSKNNPTARIINALSKLNDDGHRKAAEYVEELTDIPKYQRAEEQSEEE